MKKLMKKLYRKGRVFIHKLNLGDEVQAAGLLVMVIGIGAEIVYAANLYLVFITVGSLIFSVGTKIKGN